MNQSQLFEEFSGRIENISGLKVKISEINHDNAEVLRKHLSFSNPVPFGRNSTSMGLGDRLGIASPGHLASVRGKDIKPVLAQQSIRELELTGRTYQDVLDAASWAVFQEGYQDGFGADGDHLKNKEEIEMALNLGFSMLTLDCTEHINDDIIDLEKEEINQRYYQLAEDKANKIEKEYLNKVFILSSGKELSYNEENLKRITLIYHSMIDFTVSIYNDIIVPHERELDFEVSIDETSTPTSPEAHFFVAKELVRAGVDLNSLAPRFCGDFQKGIDYIGDLERFEREFKVHAEIADKFGYKLSIHSGSDKFSVFPIIGKYTAGRVHVKTAGTNWLEAVKIIAEYDPALYRKVHQFALDKFNKATEYYHVTTDINKIPSLAELTDGQLPKLMENDNARQLLHISYGEILQAKENGEYIFRDSLYQVWSEHEADYKDALKIHIDKHVEKLGFNS